MKVAVAVCMALLAIVLVQAEDEMAPPVLPAGSRIIGGRPAAPRQLPYMAFIQAYYGSGALLYTCAGSLVTRSAVLTAAWCLYLTEKLTVRLGSIYREGEDPNAWSAESVTAMVHPKFNSDHQDNNIAIIQLLRRAPLNEFIQLVHLPSSPVISSYIGRQGIVAGWGYTTPSSELSDVLRWGEVEVIPNEYCKRSASWAVTDRQLCAGSDNTTAWVGDMGAPLVLKVRGRYTQIGIAFNGPTTSQPATYTRVTSFTDWIKLNTESD